MSTQAENYTLYIANKNYSSWSLRPWLAMHLAGIEFKEVVLTFPDCFKNEAALAQQKLFLQASPTGKVPCLHDLSHTIKVWDSLAICDYLADKHPTKNLWPKDLKARAFARSATCEMHSSFQALRVQCSMNLNHRIQLNFIDDALKADLQRLNALWQYGLQTFGGAYLTGEACVVDAFFAPVAFRIQTYNLAQTGLFSQQSLNYVQSLLTLPAMQSWYQAALQEQTPCSRHDASSLANGTLLELIKP